MLYNFQTQTYLKDIPLVLFIAVANEAKTGWLQIITFILPPRLQFAWDLVGVAPLCSAHHLPGQLGRGLEAPRSSLTNLDGKLFEMLDKFKATLFLTIRIIQVVLKKNKNVKQKEQSSCLSLPKIQF